MKIFVAEFLADGRSCSEAFVAAAAALGAGDTLVLEKKHYHFYPEGTVKKEYFISNNDGGSKPIALPLFGKRNVTVEGNGAELIFHGEILPIVADGAENLTLRDLSIDYATPFYAQAEIRAVEKDGILLAFDGKDFSAEVRDGRFYFHSVAEGWEFCPEKTLSLEFDRHGHPSAHSEPYFAYVGAPKDFGFLSRMYQTVTLEQRAENLIFMRGGIAPRHTAGNFLVMTYSGRNCPGILITDSKDVTLRNIRLYHTLAMGVIAQRSEQLHLDGVVAQPREGSGRLLSTNADATHFVNCRGHITLENCKFVQMMDDAVNIHGIYHLYREKLGESTLRLGFGHPQQRGQQVYRIGDRIALIDAEKNETLLEATVLAAEMQSPDAVILTLDRPVPEPGECFVTENRSTAPDVHIRNCEAGHNRPRGFLLSSSGKILVENCRLYSMHQGIQLSGEMKDWFESGAVRNACIRNCDFTGCAYAGGVAIVCRPKLRCTDTVFNGRVCVEHNLFSGAEKRICHVESCDEAIFRENRFVYNDSLPSHPQQTAEGTVFLNCGRIEALPLLDQPNGATYE